MLANTNESVSENEVAVALYNWSLPWNAFLITALILNALGLSWMGVRNLFHSTHSTQTLWYLPLGASLIMATYSLFKYYSQSIEYVAEESDPALIKTLTWLGIYWYSLAAALLFMTAKCLCALVPFSIDGLEGGTIPLILLGSLIALLLVWKLKMDHKFELSQIFSKGIREYGVRTIKRIKLSSNLSFFLGGFLALKGTSDPLGETSEARIAAICAGLALLGNGLTLALYWKRVKGIIRNPARPFFQLCLNRLNFYWLTATILSVVHLSILLFEL